MQKDHKDHSPFRPHAAQLNRRNRTAELAAESRQVPAERGGGPAVVRFGSPAREKSITLCTAYTKAIIVWDFPPGLVRVVRARPGSGQAT